MLARLLDRHLRLVHIAAFIVCALFGLRAMADMIDAIGEASASDSEPPAAPVAAGSVPGGRAPGEAGRPARPAERVASGAALVERNIFCSDCAPAAPADGEVKPDPSGIPPMTALPLRLIATHVAAVEGQSSATVLHDSTANQGAYRLGEELPGAGAIVRIGGKSLDFENPGAGRVERLAIAEPAPPPTAEPAGEPAREQPNEERRGRRGRDDPELTAALDAGVRAIDETTFEVDRKLIESVIAKPGAAARGARVSLRDGGLRLGGVRPSSAHARLGLKSGDTILSVNGIELSNADNMLGAVTRLRSESSIELSIKRRGQPVTLTYRVR
ncbi:MAG TPA: type II secretion system protein GspC [Kofleriaceae bacterium]|nr:type II secretion system protein GspC [Kofleriaceae bacterium]